VAWYDFSSVPNLNSNAVFSAHVDWQTRDGDPVPGAFYRLRELQIGDKVMVTMEDGSQVEYIVTGNVATNYEDPNIVKAMQPTAKDVITLITCGGSWVNDPNQDYGGVYTHRIIVRAEKAVPVAAAAPAGG
jgi:LPXTG-site transpeptidase (sortase) family protein